MTSTSGRIWAFDFDGTLSHLVPDRDAAVLDPACEELLRDLAADRSQVVAIVSSRTLDDLRSRVRLKRVILAGGSGLEWWLPGNERLGPNQRAEARLDTQRRRLLPALTAIEKIPGVAVEDKTWSAAVHFRGVADEDRIRVAREIENLHIRHGVTLYYGPDVAEVQFLKEVSKEFAVKTLMTLYGPPSADRQLLYAGDDQNDARAMRWAMDRSGVAFIVGERISLAGAEVVPDPTALAYALRGRFQLTRTRASNRKKGDLIG